MGANPFIIYSNREMMKYWHQFRDSLSHESEIDITLTKVCQFWAKAPISTRKIDYFTPEMWPTPWELIHSGEYCRSSIALGMESTLMLFKGSPFTADRVELALIDDDHVDMYLIVIVDGHKVLNYSIGEVVTLDQMKNTTVLDRFKTTSEFCRQHESLRK